MVRLILHWVSSSQNIAFKIVDLPVETPPTKHKFILSIGTVGGSGTTEYAKFSLSLSSVSSFNEFYYYIL